MTTIAVVITCYREGTLLREAVASVRSQTRLPDELIIVNDASPDPTTNQICQEYAATPDVRVLWRECNGGTSAARNDGFAAAQSEVIVLLDADDLLPPDALRAIARGFDAHPEIGFLYGTYLRQDHGDRPGRPIAITAVALAESLRSRPFSLATNWQLIGTTPIKKSLWQQLGGYDCSYGNEELHDVEFWLRVIATGSTYRQIPETIYHWRKYLGSNSRKVSPRAWAKLAQQYRSLYQHQGLEHRALTLMVLGAKWEGAPCAQSTNELWQHLGRRFSWGALAALLLPPWLVRWAVKNTRR